MTFHIITLFPRAFDSYLGESILKRAILGIKPRRPKGSGSRPKASGKIKVKFYNPRDFADNKWKRIDRAPYGGGPGMVIQAEPVIKAVEAAVLSSLRKQGSRKAKLDSFAAADGNDKGVSKVPIIWLSPSGKQFTNESGVKYAKRKDIIIICGRYEGIDARVKRAFRIEEVSVGPFVLTGGELPAMIMIDVIARQVEGVLGDFNSREEARVASPDVYTRPEVFEYRGKKFRVPKVLLSGHHAEIENWKAAKSSRRRTSR